MMDDPELQEIFTDPAHQEIVDLLKTARPTTPPLDPHFRSYLRAKLMDEARRSLPGPSSRPWYAFGFRGRTVALSMAAVAAGFLVVLGIQVYLRSQPLPTSNLVSVIPPPIANKTDVATAAEPIQLQFTGPVDKNAVADSVVIEPATSVTKQWVGSTLVIIPNHPLAPNTSYTVKLQPKAVPPAPSTSPATKPTPTVAPTPVVVHFSTVRAPIPPVTPPSFKTGNLTYGSDSRLDKSGTILNAVWTSGGQILATRPAGLAGPGFLPTPSSTPTPSGPPVAATDVWLLSPSGTPLHNLAPGSTLPAAPASGNLFAAWTVRGSQASLDVRDLQGNLVATVATIDGTPDRAPIWVGTDRLAYLDGGTLKLVDLHGNHLTLPPLGKVQHGSIEASAAGTLLAVEAVDGSVVVDLSTTPPNVTTLPAGAGSFAWSVKGDLAFLVQANSGSNLYVAADGKHAAPVASSPNGQSWSDLNWAPDASSLLLASKPSGQTGTAGLVAINSDGSGQTSLGPKTLEYSQPQWSPRGDLVLFTRHDDATGGITFQVASLSTSGANPAEQQAIAEVDRFMQARLAGDAAGAQAELDANGQAAYQNGSASLLAAPNTKFDRYYPVTVQLTKSSPSTFLIGVRTFIARSGSETSFFEEQLTVLQQGQQYVIDGVQASASQSINRGPTVVSVEVLQTARGQQVQVSFDADLTPATVTPGTVLIKDDKGNPVEESLTFDPNSHLATLSVKLRQGTYQLVVTTGVTDIDGVPIAQEYDAPLVISR
jgi:hypothetical protein